MREATGTAWKNLVTPANPLENACCHSDAHCRLRFNFVKAQSRQVAALKTRLIDLRLTLGTIKNPDEYRNTTTQYKSR